MARIGSDSLKVFVTAAAASFVGVAIYFASKPYLHKSLPQAFEGRGVGGGG